MSQSYPWLKLPHREYLVSLTYKALKPVERLAFIELVMFAHTQENNALPDNDKFLAAWASMSLKQWLKVKANVFTEWSLVDGFWQLPKWFVIEQPTKDATQHNDNTQENDKPLTNAERCKRYRDSKKNVGDTNTDTSSDTQNMSSDTTATRTQHDSDTTKSVDSVSFGGIKGGDLDLDLKQDLDLDQELKTKTTREASVCDARFDEFWIQYPRKENKQGAIKAFKKIKPSEKLFEEILLALSKQKTWPAFQNGYAPHAATWLNAKRWEDQPPINQTTSKPITGIFNGEESDLMRANRAAMAEAKKMLFGEEAA